MPRYKHSKPEERKSRISQSKGYIQKSRFDESSSFDSVLVAQLMNKSAAKFQNPKLRKDLPKNLNMPVLGIQKMVKEKKNVQYAPRPETEQSLINSADEEQKQSELINQSELWIHQ